MRGDECVDRRILTADLCVGGDLVDPGGIGVPSAARPSQLK